MEPTIYSSDQPSDFCDESENRKQRRKKRKQKKKTKINRPRAKCTPAMAWLRELISPLVYGEMTEDGIRPTKSKKQFAAFRNNGWQLPKLPNYKIQEHFLCKRTLYYFGNGKKAAKQTLLMIDIDVLKSKGLGSPAGARAFANHLKSIWPNLYFEPSTNGKGIHCYVILEKRGSIAEEVNFAIRRLEAWLRAEAKKIDADIELVEVKGNCMEIDFEDGFIQTVKYGCFAKLPRDVARFAEWRNTTVMDFGELMTRKFDPVVEKQESKPEPEAASKHAKRKIISGSVSGKFINEDQLACIPNYENFFSAWVGPEGLMAARRWKVEPHDFAVAMVLLLHFKNDPNVDGTLPTRRVKELWTSLFENGDINRAWNHHRWKAIRDYLSDHGHIEWQDHRYQYTFVAKDEDGNVDEEESKHGIACKWEITDEFEMTLEQVASLQKQGGEGKVSFVDTEFQQLIPEQGNGESLRPTPYPISIELDRKRLCREYEDAWACFCAA
jgi:hypothetical protein